MSEPIFDHERLDVHRYPSTIVSQPTSLIQRTESGAELSIEYEYEYREAEYEYDEGPNKAFDAERRLNV